MVRFRWKSNGERGKVSMTSAGFIPAACKAPPMYFISCLRILCPQMKCVPLRNDTNSEKIFVEFASVASNTADIEYLSAPRFDFGIDKCNRVFHFTNFVISCPSNEKQNASLSKYSENDSFTRCRRPVINNLLYICDITTILTL